MNHHQTTKQVKALFSVLGSCFCIAMLCCCEGNAGPPVAGGESSASVTDTAIVEAAKFAIKAEEAALRKNKETSAAKLSLVSIVSAKQQVVAGANYRLQLKVLLDGKEKQDEAVVWWQAWRKPDPYQLTSWNWR